MKCLVAVGSTNPVKVNAVRRAFRLLCNPDVRPASVESGVPAQPLGFRELVLGAFNRACNALKAVEAADYGVGVEAGLVDTGVEHIETQAAVVIDRRGYVTIGFSQGFPLPADWAEKVKQRVELGEIAAAATGRSDIGERLGLVGYLTYGMVTRTDLTFSATVMALIPRLNPELYHRLPTAEEVQQRLRARCKEEA